jgi:hypothetical protein
VPAKCSGLVVAAALSMLALNYIAVDRMPVSEAPAINQPSTIGTFVSSGCIRLTNEDITDLHSRVKVGTRVVVLPGRGQATAVTTGLGSSGGTASRDKQPAVPSSSGVPSSSDLPAKRLTPAKRAAEPAQETPKRVVDGEANAVREPVAPASKGHQDAAGFEE